MGLIAYIENLPKWLPGLLFARGLSTAWNVWMQSYYRLADLSPGASNAWSILATSPALIAIDREVHKHIGWVDGRTKGADALCG